MSKSDEHDDRLLIQNLSEIRRDCIANEGFLDLLTNKVADRAFEKFETQRTRLNSRLTFLTSVGGVTLVALLGWFASVFQETVVNRSVRQVEQKIDKSIEIAEIAFNENLKEENNRLRIFTENSIETLDTKIAREIDTAINARVENAMKDALIEIELISNIMKFNNLTTKIDESNRFSKTEGDKALDIMKKIFDNTTKKAQVDIAPFVEKLVDSIAATGDEDLLDRAEIIAGDLMLEEQGIVLTMVQALGTRLIISSSTSFKGNREKDLIAFDKYAEASRRANFPELPFPYELLIASISNESKDSIIARIELLTGMTEMERSTVKTILKDFVDETWRSAKDTETKLVAKRTIELLETFAPFDQTKTLDDILPK